LKGDRFVFHSEDTFVDLCLKGEVLAEEIDDFVDAWHEGGTGKPLYAFLGMTREEYGLWVEKPAALSIILEARKRGGQISDFRALADFRMAARAVSEEDIEDLVEWLKRTRRISSDSGGESGSKTPLP
jgi:hypothetical protein